MKNKQLYRLCLKSGTFSQPPTFVVKIGKTQKKINTYFISSDKQRYNYDLILERSTQTDIIIYCESAGDLIGTATFKIDTKKPQQPNESLPVMNSKKQKIALLDCSLKKIDKKIKKPAIKIEVIQASYAACKSPESFIVLKYGDANYQTKASQNLDKAPIWKQTFNSPESQADRIFVQAWQSNVDGSQKTFLGLSLIDVSKSLNTQKDYQLMQDKNKKGNVKIAIYQDKGDKQVDIPINDKNIVKKRTIKAYAVQALTKNQIKKGAFIRLSSGGQQFQTTPIFKQTKQLSWNQAFMMVVNSQKQQLTAQLLIKDQIQEEIGRATIEISKIQNKKYELPLIDGAQKQIGTVYLQFYDQELDIKQEIMENKSQNAISKPSQESIPKQSKLSKISQKTSEKLSQTAQDLKARYASRQPIHDYMNQVNTVLQTGLLKIAKQRPQNPIKQLGLYLINYKKP